MDEVEAPKEATEIDKVNMNYGILCAQLGDLLIRSESNDRKIEETKRDLHKLQARAQKLHTTTKSGLVVVPDPTPEEVTNGPA